MILPLRAILFYAFPWLFFFLAAGPSQADVCTKATQIGSSLDPIVSLAVGNARNDGLIRSVFVGNGGPEILEYWSTVSSPNVWIASPVGSTGGSNWPVYVAIGDADNDASNELYALGMTGAGEPELESYVFQNGWKKKESIHPYVDLTDGPLQAMNYNGLVIGDPRNTGFNAIYFPSRDQRIYEVYKNVAGWQGTKIDPVLNYNATALAIGDGDNSLSKELYIVDEMGTLYLFY